MMFFITNVALVMVAMCQDKILNNQTVENLQLNAPCRSRDPTADQWKGEWSLRCDAINNQPDSRQREQMDHSLNYKFSDKPHL